MISDVAVEEGVDVKVCRSDDSPLNLEVASSCRNSTVVIIGSKEGLFTNISEKGFFTLMTGTTRTNCSYGMF